MGLERFGRNGPGSFREPRSLERASSAAAVHKRNMQAPVLVRALPLLLTVLHSVEGYGSGSPSFGMPNSYNMVREAMMHMQIECLLART